MIKIISFTLLILSLSAFAKDRLSGVIPYPFYEVQENKGNKVMVIDNGVAALELRLQMIRRAQKNIEVEYFIYNTDMAGKIFTRELVDAANRGVKVRILIDKSLPIFQFNAFYAHELAKNGIEVKYYNTAPLIALSTVQFRNHRKQLSIDDIEALTGGRNIGDDYFDMSPHFNFMDRDIYVTGPIVKTMRESFDSFFNHKISKKAKRPSRPIVSHGGPKNNDQNSEARARQWDRKVKKAEAFLDESPEETLLRSRMSDIGRSILANTKMHDCTTATFSSDAPGANFTARNQDDYLEKYRFLRQTLAEKTLQVDKAFTISSPYLINNHRTKDIMHYLLDRKVDIKVYTNSLGSTDAIYVAANLYLYLKQWASLGIKIYLHDGKFIDSEGPAMTPEAEKAHWGTHDKTQVYESSTHTEVMVGTYNIDNRSNFYNAEMALFCKGNDELSMEVKNSILRRIDKSVHIDPQGKAFDKDGVQKNVYAADQKKVFIMKLITLPSWLLNFLL